MVVHPPDASEARIDLHCHSSASIEAAGKPPDIAAFYQQAGYAGFGLTEHNNWTTLERRPNRWVFPTSLVSKLPPALRTRTLSMERSLRKGRFPGHPRILLRPDPGPGTDREQELRPDERVDHHRRGAPPGRGDQLISDSSSFGRSPASASARTITGRIPHTASSHWVRHMMHEVWCGMGNGRTVPPVVVRVSQIRTAASADCGRNLPGYPNRERHLHPRHPGSGSKSPSDDKRTRLRHWLADHVDGIEFYHPKNDPDYRKMVASIVDATVPVTGGSDRHSYGSNRPVSEAPEACIDQLMRIRRRRNS